MVSAPTFINSRELTEGRNPAAVSQRSSLTENSVKQEGKQQVFTRRRKPFENSKIVHVREAIQ